MPGLYANLFSLTKAIEHGCTLGNEDERMFIRKGDFHLTFDRFVWTTNVFLGGVIIYHREENSAAIMRTDCSISYDQLHEKLGHINHEQVKQTAKALGWNLTGNTKEKCDNCAIGKAHQANISKKEKDRASKPGERLFLDINSVQGTSLGGSKFWALLLDDATNCKWSFMLKKKSELSKTVVEFIKDLKAKFKYEVKYI